jgi:hypothetical protein
VDRRTLFVAMDDIVDAIDTHHQEESQFYLDTETGEVVLWMDPVFTGEEPGFDPEDRRFAKIPRSDRGEDHRAMAAFAAGLADDPDVRAALERALVGRGPFAAFRQVLAPHPDLKSAWERDERDRRVAQAVAWLHELGIEPQFELRPLPEPRPVGGARPRDDEARVGLFDLLLLGAPGGKPELLDGRVQRRVVAATPEQARKLFVRVARELCEHHGLGWRRRFVEDRDDYEIERCRMSVRGRAVELSVAVAPAVWQLFSPSSGS